MTRENVTADLLFKILTAFCVALMHGEYVSVELDVASFNFFLTEVCDSIDSQKMLLMKLITSYSLHLPIIHPSGIDLSSLFDLSSI